jgi:hypothetical protein
MNFGWNSRMDNDKFTLIFNLCLTWWLGMIVLLSSNCVYNKDNRDKIILAIIIEHNIQTSNQAYNFIQFLLAVIDLISL